MVLGQLAVFLVTASVEKQEMNFLCQVGTGRECHERNPSK